MCLLLNLFICLRMLSQLNKLRKEKTICGLFKLICQSLFKTTELTTEISIRITTSYQRMEQEYQAGSHNYKTVKC